MYDKTKYKLTKVAPKKWAQNLPGVGLQEFDAAYLTNDDMERLLAAGSPYVERLPPSGK